MTLFADTEIPRSRPGAHFTRPRDVRSLIDDVRRDAQRVARSVNLAANENVLSRTARQFLDCTLSDRYLLGVAAERGRSDVLVRGGLLSTGYPGVDSLESAALEAAQAIFGADHVEFRPLSGLHATIATVGALTGTGDTVYSLEHRMGGHFATPSLLHSMGRRPVRMAWDATTGELDLPAFARQWNERPGRMVFLDHGAPLGVLPTEQIRRIIGPDAVLVYDASHTLGLIAGGAYQSPLAEGCDVLQGNTHKSFPGAHKGMLMFRDVGLGEAVSRALAESFVSSQQTGATLANYVTTLEMAQHGRAYATAMLRNADALRSALVARGATVRGFADPRQRRTHLVLVDSVAGAEPFDVAHDLVGIGMHVNARTIGTAACLRIGVQEITRRGMGVAEMVEIADIVTRGETGRTAKARVSGLARRHPHIRFSADGNST